MPRGRPFSIRLADETLREVRALGKRLDRPVSRVASALIEEGLRQRRCPGIVFSDGPTGRRATVAGCGVDAWEVVRVYLACAGDVEAVVQALPQLSRRQVDAALHYYRCYPQEIDERLALEERAEEEIAHRHPMIRTLRV